MKAIPAGRDRLQSRVLVWVAAPVLGCVAISTLRLVAAHDGHFPGHAGRFDRNLLSTIPMSVLFALVAWRLRAATPAAAACGGLMCLLITLLSFNPGSSIFASGLAPLILLFVLTLLATRAGRQRKSMSGLAESRRGRNAAQVIANLGMAAWFGSFQGFRIVDWAQRGWTWVGDPRVFIGLFYLPMLAALAEATADTVSSEIGQAFGDRPVMLTTLRRVERGTDGAISGVGTLAGIAGAAIIAATGMPALGMSVRECVAAFAAGVMGLFFDSLLGATVERKGWMGNDLVNFASTAFAAGVALVAIRVGRDWLLR